MNKIYKLVYNGVVVYVGKTKQTLKRRKASGYKDNSAVQAIYKQCDIVLIEETSDVAREDFWIQHYKDTLFNIRRGDTGLSRKEYTKKYDKEWYQANKEHLKEHRKEYMKEWCQSNREHHKEYMREYRLKNKLNNGITNF
jgi:hypothetical protein